MVCELSHVPLGITYHVATPCASYTKTLAKRTSRCCSIVMPQPFSEVPAHQRSWYTPPSTASIPKCWIPDEDGSLSPRPPSVSAKLTRLPWIVEEIGYHTGGPPFVAGAYTHHWAFGGSVVGKSMLTDAVNPEPHSPMVEKRTAPCGAARLCG